MNKRTREQKLNDGMTYQGFELNGKFHKPLTAASMKFLQRINSPIYTAQYENYPEVDIILEYLYATSHDYKQLAEAPAKWDTLQFEYADQFNVADITKQEVVDNILRDIQNQRAANVEVRNDESEKKSVTNPTG